MLQTDVVLSLVGILSGLVVLYGLLTGKPFGGWTALFLGATILTRITGFFLPPRYCAVRSQPTSRRAAEEAGAKHQYLGR